MSASKPVDIDDGSAPCDGRPTYAMAGKIRLFPSLSFSNTPNLSGQRANSPVLMHRPASQSLAF